jgi:chorismate synthase
LSGNSFGEAFRITTFGESHGVGVGVVIDGVPPGLELGETDIQVELDRRKPGQSEVTTSRREADLVRIVSGVFDGRTTGTSLAMLLYNEDARPDAYLDIKDLFRPGHADFTYRNKFGLRDWRGSGRASGRETAARVAAGAVAKKILKTRGVSVLAYTVRAAGVACRSFEPQEIERNPLRACDPAAAARMVEAIKVLAAEKDSAGGVVECRIEGVPAGLGEPVFDKLDAVLAAAMLSIGSVKGIEFGSGFAAADLRGSQHNDQMGAAGFLSNNAGGILGGISTGQTILFRMPVKPVSSLARPQKTVDTHGAERIILTEGRHDVCICPRVVPVVEAMAALVVEDMWKRQAGLFT